MFVKFGKFEEAPVRIISGIIDQEVEKTIPNG